MLLLLLHNVSKKLEKPAHHCTHQLINHWINYTSRTMGSCVLVFRQPAKYGGFGWERKSNKGRRGQRILFSPVN